MKRHRVRVNVTLPELTAAQVHALCAFLGELASDLWEAYEDELFDFEAEAFHALAPDPDHHDDTAGGTADPSTQPDPTSDDDSNF